MILQTNSNILRESEYSLKIINGESAEVTYWVDYIDNNYSYNVIKQSIKEFYFKDKSMRFFINKNFVVKGKITNKIEEGII